MPHTPGRGHRRKSDAIKKRRRQREAAKKKSDAQRVYVEALARWNAMTDEQKHFLPELHPDNYK